MPILAISIAYLATVRTCDPHSWATQALRGFCLTNLVDLHPRTLNMKFVWNLFPGSKEDVQRFSFLATVQTWVPHNWAVQGLLWNKPCSASVKQQEAQEGQYRSTGCTGIYFHEQLHVLLCLVFQMGTKPIHPWVSQMDSSCTSEFFVWTHQALDLGHSIDKQDLCCLLFCMSSVKHPFSDQCNPLHSRLN